VFILSTETMGIFSKLAVVVTVSSAMAYNGPANGPLYESQKASEKNDFIWSKVIADESKGTWPSTLSLAKLFLESMSPSVDYVSDEFPAGRQKLIHSVGVAAQCSFEWDEAAVSKLGYTGLFQKATYGTIRASSAIQPKFGGGKAEDSSFVPGVGFKFFRDGVHSADFVAMHLLKPWDTWNWFKYPLSNHLSSKNLPTAQNLLAKKFSTVSNWAPFVGLSDFARYSEDGIAEAKPVSPFQLVLYPNPDLTAKYTDDFTDDYFTQFTRDIPAGTVLYSIWAIDAPGAAPVAIGKVVTKTAFTPSKYADNTLFLKHTAYEEDLALHPEWLNGCPSVEECKVCPVDVECDAQPSSSL
jgi:hypothetical protein